MIPEPLGWNTWDVRHHTAVVHLPSGLRLRFALAADGVEPAGVLTWRHGLVRLGRHTVDGRYAEASVRQDGVRLDYRFAAAGDTLSASARRDGPRGLVPTLFVDRLDGIDGGHVALLEHVGDRLLLADGDRRWELRVAGVFDVACDDATLRLAGGDTLAVTCRPAPPSPAVAAAAAPVTIAAPGPELATSGWLGDSGAALARSLTWNTVYSPVWRRVVTPASRDFVSRQREGFYATIAVHGWDSFLTGALAGLIDAGYAEGMFDQAFAGATPDGFVPNRVSDERGTTTDRSQPPVGALSVLRAYLSSGLSESTREASLLRFVPPLRRWSDWWPRARRGPCGMLAFGSDPVAGDTHAGTLDAAKRESGLDDSPMYDEAGYDPATHTMNLADVGLNALYAADLEALAELTARAGDPLAAAELRSRYESWRGRIDAELFDPATGLYLNRHSDGRFSPHLSPTLLYPLLAGVPDAARAAAIADTLLAPEVLGGSPPLLSTARNDPGFTSRYWRGRVWGPIAYLAAEGLRRYRLEDHLAPVADELLRLHRREWEHGSHVRENYATDPGEDLDPLAARSDALHPWGNLLSLVAIQRLVCAEADGWRFAHPGRPAGVTDLVLAEGRLSVRAGDGLTVTLDGAPLIVADRPASIEAFGYDRDATTGRLGATGPVLVRAPAGAVRLTLDGRVTDAVPDERGLVEIAAGGVDFALRRA